MEKWALSTLLSLMVNRRSLHMTYQHFVYGVDRHCRTVVV